MGFSLRSPLAETTEAVSLGVSYSSLPDTRFQYLAHVCEDTMSAISNIHSVTLFVRGQSKAAANQTLIKVGYKPTKNRKTGETIPAKYKAICVSLPNLSFEGISDSIRVKVNQIALEYLNETRTEMVRNMYETRKGNLFDISSDEMNLDSVFGYLDSKGRISADNIGKWFDQYCADNLAFRAAVVCKYLTDTDSIDSLDTLTEEQLKTVSSKVTPWRELFVNLTRDRDSVKYVGNQLETLERMVSLYADESDSLAAKITAKIAEWNKPVESREILAENLF